MKKLFSKWFARRKFKDTETWLETTYRAYAAGYLAGRKHK